MVQLNMEDHRHEDFKPSASKVKPFAGKGHTLGRFVFTLSIAFRHPQLESEITNYVSSPTPNMKDEDVSSAVPIPSGSASDNESNEKR